MKKLIMLCFTLLISITLVACGSNDNNNKDANNANNTNVEEPNTNGEENTNDEANDEENADQDADSEVNEEPGVESGENEDTNAENQNGESAADFDFDPNGENIVALELEQNGVSLKLTYKADGDKVIEQTADNVIPYETIGASNAEEAEEILAELVEGYQDVKGITHNIEYQDNQAIESVTTNYEELDFEEASELEGVTLDGDISQGVSLQKSVDMLVQQGFKIVD